VEVAVNPDFVSNARNALLSLFEAAGRRHDPSAREIQKTLEFNLTDPNALFGATWRVANAASNLASESNASLRTALTSLAYHGYDFCAGRDPKFEKSRSEALRFLNGQRPSPLQEILFVFQDELGHRASVEKEGTHRSEESAEPQPERPLSSEGYSPQGSDTAAAERRPAPIFAKPQERPYRDEFEAFVGSFERLEAVAKPTEQLHAIASFEKVLKQFMAVADQGRTFTDSEFLTSDLERIRPYLQKFRLARNPRDTLGRAIKTRGFAKSLDFYAASAEDFQCARFAWLISAYWNSLLLERHWESNLPNVAYDFLGYLALTQAEIRYSEAEFLLLLRISFSITRIATYDDFVPLQFLRAEADDLQRWLRHTIGTVLATAGPGRVAPSRVKDDPRLPRDREDFARTLLEVWQEPQERAAAATLLLEMGGWEADRAHRLIEQVFPRDSASAQLEVWSRAVTDRASSSARVRVVRPNPWRPSTGAMITVEEEAIASLAADVLALNYPVLGGDISLSGHAFRTRRVPTFICSAEYGPLGLFKIDTNERVEREVQNFAKYAQRLHPRYRAGRCDYSMAVVTEPDDDKQFVRGVMTSYVFTQEEAPRTLTGWLTDSGAADAQRICHELFGTALRPWYDHAKVSTVDAFNEFPVLNGVGVTRLLDGCREHHSIDLELPNTPGNLTLTWIRGLLACLDGAEDGDGANAELAARLQVLRSHRSVCHGDLHLDNVLVIGKAGAEYPCVIDFEATHEGYILKDCFRFLAASVARTHDWSDEEAEYLCSAIPQLVIDGGEPSEPPSENSAKVLAVHRVVLRDVYRIWRGNDGPPQIERGISLIAGFLPFARYPDTRVAASKLLLAMCDRTVSALSA
jgi:hypothetical protein